MSNSDDEMEDYIKSTKSKLSNKNVKKTKNSFNFSLNFFNPYVAYVISFLVIFFTIFLIKPKAIKNGKKVVFLKLFLISLIVYIPVFFFIFLFFQKK
jgi:hypothetical protein